MLSHPLLVEAIVDLFEPVAVFNSEKGRDAELLKRFGEPAWNNPVVRFVDAAGRDWIARRDGVWTPAGIAARMVEALRAARRSVPQYLELLAAEGRVRKLGKATFAMH
ncbi:MAG: hypothetical protein KDC87_14330 [Planctomycetes bacterium]|nr:hypothetical protein [Planctomycetota bacterium]MCB9871305.1 hypothetical protein [Planctomycetota bacterium]